MLVLPPLDAGLNFVPKIFVSFCGVFWATQVDKVWCVIVHCLPMSMTFVISAGSAAARACTECTRKPFYVLKPEW